MVSVFKMVSAPSSGAVLMAIDNGTKRAEVRSKGTTGKLDLVGATTVTKTIFFLALTSSFLVLLAISSLSFSFKFCQILHFRRC